MGKGLFNTLYKKKGPFKALFTEDGAKIQLERSDLRLGDYGQDAGLIDVPKDAPPPPDISEPKPPGAPKSKKSFFMRDIAGIPVWLICVVGLGFAFKYKKRKKEAETALTE